MQFSGAVRKQTAKLALCFYWMPLPKLKHNWLEWSGHPPASFIKRLTLNEQSSFSATLSFGGLFRGPWAGSLSCSHLFLQDGIAATVFCEGAYLCPGAKSILFVCHLPAFFVTSLSMWVQRGMVREQARSTCARWTGYCRIGSWSWIIKWKLFL